MPPVLMVKMNHAKIKVLESFSLRDLWASLLLVREGIMSFVGFVFKAVEQSITL